MAKYAVLLSGGVNNKSNEIRYNNNLGYAYTVLTKKLNYKEENIYPLYANGVDLKYNGLVIKSQLASSENFIKTLESISFREDDILFILVSNHGGKNDFINLWGDGITLSLKDFSGIMNKVKCKKIILFGQCHGGNICNYHLDNTFMMTANQAGLVSYSRICSINQEPDYDEFIYHFISYYNGSYPDGTCLKTSAYDNDLELAFKYASNYDIFNPCGLDFNVKINQVFNAIEIPQLINTIHSSDILTL